LRFQFILHLSAAACIAACAAAGPSGSPATGSEAQLAGSIAAEQRTENDDFSRRLEALQKVIAAPTFKSLPGDVQYQDLLTAGKLAAALEQPRRAYDYVAAAAATPHADFSDRLLQVESAVTLGLKADAVSGMTIIVQRWPEQVAALPTGLLDEILRESGSLPHEARLSLLRGLYGMHWKLKGDIEPSETWRDLALLLLDRGLRVEAIDVSAHVDDVYVLIAMRADRRFDAVVAAHRDQYDIAAAAERQLKNLESVSDGNPHSLALKTDLLLELVHQQHYGAMLAESDSVLAALESTNFRDKLYDDYYEQYSRFLNLRSLALQRTGRWDEAVEQLKAASDGNNVNQLINLGTLYCALDRPREALEAIARVKGDASPYGAMQVEWVHLEAAQQLGDSRQAAESIQFLKKHAVDAPWAYMGGLLSTNQLDRAAGFLIVELRDPEQRQDALAGVQDYASKPETPRDLEFSSRWRAVVARKDVQAAIQQVGRVASYHLEEP
jgi:tetratricopeptide (TPR) repeat protein